MWLGPEMQYPYTIAMFRRDNPGVGIRDNPPAEVLAPYNVFPATEIPPPKYDRARERVVPEPWTPQGDGFVRGWRVVDLTPEEIAERLQTRREHMHMQRVDARIAMVRLGLWDRAREAIDGAAEPERSLLLAHFEDAQMWRRLDPWLVALGRLVGLDDAALDGLFQ